MLKNIRTPNNQIKQRSYTRNHSMQACTIVVLLAITNSNPRCKCLFRQLPTKQQISSNKKQKYFKNNQMEKH